MLDIVRMGLERRDRIAAIWTAAFEHDPLMEWIFPDEATRLESLRRWWLFSLDHLLPGSELHGTRIDGCVAYWQSPQDDQTPPAAGGDDVGSDDDGSSDDDVGSDDGFGSDDDVGLEPDSQARFAALMTEMLGDLAPSRMEALGRMHQARPSEPHWYLAVLGTSPDQQSRGLGGRVLAPMLERCDRTGVPAYLESSNPANVGFYRRHGFEATGRFVLDDDVLVTPMFREPHPPPF